MAHTLIAKPEVLGQRLPLQDRILTPGALEFLAWLHRRFEPRRRQLLVERGHRQTQIEAGEFPALRPETIPVRDAGWTIDDPPVALERRWVELLTSTSRKTMITAFNSGADGVIADLEDSFSPTWTNVLDAHSTLHDAVRRTLTYETDEGFERRMPDAPPVLWIRPRGWHLAERHVSVDGQPLSASLFDFGLFAYHNAHELRSRNVGVYAYLPKLEGHREARLWNDVFLFVQDALGIPVGTIRVTAQIETVLGAFEMEEIIYELRDHIVGLSAGRWDYVFSIIKKFRHRPEFVLPERSRLRPDVPFLRALSARLVDVCHRRGVHAIGGPACGLPGADELGCDSRTVSELKTDLLRDCWEGFDGSWVAHPRLVGTAREAYRSVLETRPHQKEQQNGGSTVPVRTLLDVRVPDSVVTLDGVTDNVNIALRYLYAWLAGTGAVSIYDLRQDTATAEVARGQLWQWIHHGIAREDGEPVDVDLYERLRDEERTRLMRAGAHEPLLDRATHLLDRLVLSDEFLPFLTLPGYRLLG